MFKKRKGNAECLYGFVDADYGGDRDKKKSLTSYIFTAWGMPLAKLQSVIVLSSFNHISYGSNKGNKRNIMLKGDC